MKKWDKKTIMYRLDRILPDNFECNHIQITFPNDDTARIELMNDSDADRNDGDGSRIDFSLEVDEMYMGD